MALRTSEYAVTLLSKRVKKGEVAIVTVVNKNGVRYYALDDRTYNETIMVPVHVAPGYWANEVIR